VTGQVSKVPTTHAARICIHMNDCVLQQPCCGFGDQPRRLIGVQHELEDDIAASPETALPNTSDTTGNPTAPHYPDFATGIACHTSRRSSMHDVPEIDAP
jgi:hypothetical protein